jgi:catechol 2,3-dioxygenase-like lactoylglutathione lyase family enzyme
MLKDIVHIAIVVKDYDEAIQFYTQKLGFVLIEDIVLSEFKRWVLVAPNVTSTCKILLAKAANQKQIWSIGNQAGGRVFLFLHTTNLEEDYNKLQNNGVKFVRQPTVEVYGKVAVFEDLYGNRWDLIEYNATDSIPN